MIKRLAICLILGVLTTIAVAWGCALINPIKGRMIGSLRFDRSDSWSYWVFQRPGVTYVQRAPANSMQIPNMSISGTATLQFDPNDVVELPQWSNVRVPPTVSEVSTKGTRIEDARGWPLVAMISYTKVDSTSPTNAAPTSSTEYGWQIHRVTSVAPLPDYIAAIPFAPLWPGFAIDTATYFIVWVILLMVPSAIRRRGRQRINQCTICGYDLRAAVDGRCPECGAISQSHCGEDTAR